MPVDLGEPGTPHPAHPCPAVPRADLERAGAQLQPVLQELVHRRLHADALLLGQRGHREGTHDHLFPD